MEQWFCRMADLALSGSIAILGVLAFRRMLRNQPKIFSYVLWIIVGIRLLLPISFVGVWGGFGLSDDIGHIMSVEDVQHGQSIDGMDHVMPLLFLVWIAGVGVLAVKNVLAYFRLKKRVQVSMRVGEYYVSDHISGAFVLGLARPRIYLSSSLVAEEHGYILAHEKVHLRRRDYLWKWLAECILCVHWFNPLAWLAFRKFSEDMEMSCDEAVLRRECRDGRMAYARVLLTEMAESRENGMVPFFRRGGTERRIHNMMKVKMWSKKRAGVCAGVVLAAAALLLPGFWQGGVFGKAAEEHSDIVSEQDADMAGEQDEQFAEEEQTFYMDEAGDSDAANKLKVAIENCKGREYGYPTSIYVYSFEGDGEMDEEGKSEKYRDKN